jgi:Protein of unknown function (DUF2950)
MRRTNRNLENFCRSNLSVLATLAVALLLTGFFPARSMAQQKGQKTFSSAEAASAALFAALEANDEKAILDVLGQDAKPIISSGNENEDSEHHANFVRRYLEMHRLVKEPDGTTTLYIGAENWPTPIPLVEKAGAWYFDTEAAKEEILFRRIGHNEMSAIRNRTTCTQRKSRATKASKTDCTGQFPAANPKARLARWSPRRASVRMPPQLQVRPANRYPSMATSSAS